MLATGSPAEPVSSYTGGMENSPRYEAQTPEALAAALAQHPDFRVLRRLDVSGQRPPLAAAQPGRAAVIDTETTGTDLQRDKVIELAVVVFEYDRDTGEIGPVVARYSAFEDPGFPIPPESTAIHHITDDMVRGQRFNELARFNLDCNRTYLWRAVNRSVFALLHR